jgi:surfeit locus 1 family protein
VLVLVVVAVFVSLGFWQLRRLDERRDRNALVEARTSAAAVGVADLPDDLDEARFRAVVASGEYDAERTVALRTTQQGTPGGWVFSVMDLADSQAVVVLRGFVGTQPDGSIPAPAPPAEDVEVEGIAIPTARLERPAERAVNRLLDSVPGALPVVVQAQASDPVDAPDTLSPVPIPDLGEGPHLGYAVQWFLFAGVVVVAYPPLLRRQARDGHGG